MTFVAPKSKFTALTIVVVIFAMFVSIGVYAAPGALAAPADSPVLRQDNLSRVSGVDRYATSAAVSRATFSAGREFP